MCEPPLYFKRCFRNLNIFLFKQFRCTKKTGGGKKRRYNAEKNKRWNSQSLHGVPFSAMHVEAR